MPRYYTEEHEWIDDGDVATGSPISRRASWATSCSSGSRTGAELTQGGDAAVVDGEGGERRLCAGRRHGDEGNSQRGRSALVNSDRRRRLVLSHDAMTRASEGLMDAKAYKGLCAL